MAIYKIEFEPTGVLKGLDLSACQRQFEYWQHLLTRYFNSETKGEDLTTCQLDDICDFFKSIKSVNS